MLPGLPPAELYGTSLVSLSNPPFVHKVLPQLPVFAQIFWTPPSNWELITSQGRVMRKVSLPPAPYSQLILFK